MNWIWLAAIAFGGLLLLNLSFIGVIVLIGMYKDWRAHRENG